MGTLILDKVDNERGIALLRSPSSASVSQHPLLDAINAADAWHLLYSRESETRHLRPARFFSFSNSDDVWRKLTMDILRDVSLQLIDFTAIRDDNVMMFQMITI